MCWERNVSGGAVTMHLWQFQQLQGRKNSVRIYKYVIFMTSYPWPISIMTSWSRPDHWQISIIDMQWYVSVLPLTGWLWRHKSQQTFGIGLTSGHCWPAPARNLPDTKCFLGGSLHQDDSLTQSHLSLKWQVRLTECIERLSRVVAATLVGL